MSGIGGLPTQMLFGSPTSQAGFGMAGSLGPLWQQKQMLPYVGEAYDIGSQLLGPGFQGGGGTPWGDMLMKMISGRMGEGNPGMTDPEWRQGLGAIGQSAEDEKARAMSLLGSMGGGSVDPRAAASAMSRISEGVPTAVSNLAAKRSGLNLQAIMGLGGLQQPLARQELMNAGQNQAQYGSELRGLAGNMLQGGSYPAGNQQAALAATQGPTAGTMGFWR